MPLQEKQVSTDMEPVAAEICKVAVGSGVPPESKSNSWFEAFRRAAATEEEGGRELRQFLESESATPAVDEDDDNADGLETHGGFSQPAALAAFTRRLAEASSEEPSR